jgi:hypothetical protein
VFIVAETFGTIVGLMRINWRCRKTNQTNSYKGKPLGGQDDIKICYNWHKKKKHFEQLNKSNAIFWSYKVLIQPEERHIMSFINVLDLIPGIVIFWWRSIFICWLHLIVIVYIFINLFLQYQDLFTLSIYNDLPTGISKYIVRSIFNFFFIYFNANIFVLTLWTYL